MQTEKEQINQAITNLQAITNVGGSSDRPEIEEMAAVTADILSETLRSIERHIARIVAVSVEVITDDPSSTFSKQIKWVYDTGEMKAT